MPQSKDNRARAKKCAQSCNTLVKFWPFSGPLSSPCLYPLQHSAFLSPSLVTLVGRAKIETLSASFGLSRYNPKIRFYVLGFGVHGLGFTTKVHHQGVQVSGVCAVINKYRCILSDNPPP